MLQRSPKLGLEPLAFVDDDPSKTGNMVYEMAYERRRSAPVVTGPVTRELVAEYGADLVLIAIPSIGHDRFARTIEEAFAGKARVSFVPNYLLASDPWVDYQDIDGVLLANSGRPLAISATRPRKGFATFGIACTYGDRPPIFLLLAVAIKVDSSGPVLFRQERVGQTGNCSGCISFVLWGLRSPSYEYSPQASNDPGLRAWEGFSVEPVWTRRLNS